MTEPENRPSAMPIAIAFGIVVTALLIIGALRLFLGDDVPDDGLVGRAVVAQNDALQRENYADFRRYTCPAQQGAEAQVIADQQQSKSAKGNRFVDDVTEIAITGDRATATVVYHFEKAADTQVKVPMTFVRENGQWTVCSPGPR